MVWAERAHQNQKLVMNSWILGICFHVQASDNTTMANVDRTIAPTHHQDHISAENREPRTRGIPYWEVKSHETRETPSVVGPLRAAVSLDYDNIHMLMWSSFWPV